MAFKMRGFSGFKQRPAVPPGEGEVSHDISYSLPADPSKLKGKKPSTGLLEELEDYGPSHGHLIPARATTEDSQGNPGLVGNIGYGGPGVEEHRDTARSRQLGNRVIDKQFDIDENQGGHQSKSQKDAMSMMKGLEERMKNNVGRRGGSSPAKQYADKNVSVDKISDDGRTFTGTDSKGKTGKYKTSGYDAEVMQSDSVGVTGDAVSNMQMEYDMVKGTKYEKDFIDYHGKGNKPGTGKSPAKSRADRKAGRAAKAAQKHAQAEDRGKSRKADRQAVKVAKHGGHAEAAGTSSGTPMFQTSHGPIREFNPPRNPNEGPYIVRSKPTGQTVEPNNDGPDYRHIRERTGLDDGPHPERPQSIGPSPHQSEILKGRPKQLRNYDAFVKGAKEAMKSNSPAKKRGLWDNIHAKRRRGEKMREKGDKGAPTEKAMRDSQSPAKQVARVKDFVQPTRTMKEHLPAMKEEIAIPVQRIDRTGMRIQAPIAMPEMAREAERIEAIPVQRIGMMVSEQKKTAKRDNKTKKGRI